MIYFVRGEKDEDEKWVGIGVLLFFIMLLILIVISTLKTGSATPGCLEKLTRYTLFSVRVHFRDRPIPFFLNRYDIKYDTFFFLDIDVNTVSPSRQLRSHGIYLTKYNVV